MTFKCSFDPSQLFVFSSGKREKLILVTSVIWDPPLKIRRPNGETAKTNILVSEHFMHQIITHTKMAMKNLIRSLFLSIYFFGNSDTASHSAARGAQGRCLCTRLCSHSVPTTAIKSIFHSTPWLLKIPLLDAAQVSSGAAYEARRPGLAGPERV